MIYKIVTVAMMAGCAIGMKLKLERKPTRHTKFTEELKYLQELECDKTKLEKIPLTGLWQKICAVCPETPNYARTKLHVLMWRLFDWQDTDLAFRNDLYYRFIDLAKKAGFSGFNFSGFKVEKDKLRKAKHFTALVNSYWLKLLGVDITELNYEAEGIQDWNISYLNNQLDGIIQLDVDDLFSDAAHLPSGFPGSSIKTFLEDNISGLIPSLLHVFGRDMNMIYGEFPRNDASDVPVEEEADPDVEETMVYKPWYGISQFYSIDGVSKHLKIPLLEEGTIERLTAQRREEKGNAAFNEILNSETKADFHGTYKRHCNAVRTNLEADFANWKRSGHTSAVPDFREFHREAKRERDFPPMCSFYEYGGAIQNTRRYFCPAETVEELRDAGVKYIGNIR